MKYTPEDIARVKSFALRLSAACEDITGGKPKSRALEDHHISRSLFYTILRGLHQAESLTQEEVDGLKHPAWQDELTSDLGVDEPCYMPADFEETLTRMEGTLLAPEEREVIEAYYKGHKSIAEISVQLGIAESTVRSRRRSALKELSAHREELVLGAEYLDRLRAARQAQSDHLDEMRWMQDAIDWIEDTDAESAQSLEDMEISEEARQFYREHGLTTVAEAMRYDLAGIFDRCHK